MKLHHILLVISLPVIFATGCLKPWKAVEKAEAPGDKITVTLDKPGNISAAIYDKDGRNGGRADGPFVATDFLNIRDIVATKDGGFLMCEGGASLRRTAQFDRQPLSHALKD